MEAADSETGAETAVSALPGHCPTPDEPLGIELAVAGWLVGFHFVLFFQIAHNYLRCLLYKILALQTQPMGLREATWAAGW